MRFNDFAFALHAVALSSVYYSQFWPWLWKFKVSRHQKVSGPAAGIFWGSLIAIAIVVAVIRVKSPDGGYDASSWAWIDAVSRRSLQHLPMQLILIRLGRSIQFHM